MSRVPKCKEIPSGSKLALFPSWCQNSTKTKMLTAEYYFRLETMSIALPFTMTACLTKLIVAIFYCSRTKENISIVLFFP